MERLEAISDWLVRASSWILLASVLGNLAGQGKIAPSLAAAGLGGLVSVVLLRLIALALRLWRERDRVRAGMVVVLLLLLGLEAVRHWYG